MHVLHCSNMVLATTIVLVSYMYISERVVVTWHSQRVVVTWHSQTVVVTWNSQRVVVTWHSQRVVVTRLVHSKISANTFPFAWCQNRKVMKSNFIKMLPVMLGKKTMMVEIQHFPTFQVIPLLCMLRNWHSICSALLAWYIGIPFVVNTCVWQVFSNRAMFHSIILAHVDCTSTPYACFFL